MATPAFRHHIPAAVDVIEKSAIALKHESEAQMVGMCGGWILKLQFLLINNHRHDLELSASDQFQ